jgi:FKBP-type peptidyl-prolyl cis-trans isomerase
MKSENVIFILIMVVMIGGLGSLVYVVNAQKTKNDITASSNNDSQNTENMDNQTNTKSTFSELIKEDTVIGTGDVAEPGRVLTVNYTGKLLDGTVFDSSLNAGRTPFEFTLGAGEVIQGWDQGFEGMKVGGKRTLKVPSSLGYGSRGAGALIKPNSDLIFEVELLGVK